MTCPVSVLITARDEEETIAGALASVAGWPDEVIVVVDPRTVDRTREIARGAGAIVVEHEYESSAAQCNWGLERCSREWVFVLDADERVDGRLRGAIAAAVAEPRHPAYRVRRTNFAFGRRLRFGDWGHDSIVRLVRRGAASFETKAVHGAVRAASVGTLEGELAHHTLRSLEQYGPKLVEYAFRGAADALVRGRSVSWWTVLVRSEWRFVRAFFLRLGFLDGTAGFVVARLAAAGTFLKWSAVWAARVTKTPSHP